MSQTLTEQYKSRERQTIQQTPIPKQKHTLHVEFACKLLKKTLPVYVVLGVRHSVLLNDALRWQVGNSTAEAVSTDVIGP